MSATNPVSALHRAQEALSRGDFNDAVALCRRLLAQDARHTEARYCLGLGLALAGQADAAIEQWLQVLQHTPCHFATLVNLGVALSEQGDHLAGIARLRAALAIDNSLAQVHYCLGNCLLATGELDGAISALRHAVERDPHWAQARNNLGVAYRRAGRNDEASAEFTAAIAAHPNYADAYSNLGAALQSTGQFEAALASFRRALSLDQHNLEAALGLGQTLERLGRTDEAIALLSSAAAANPGTVAVHYALGISLHRSGQLESALACYQRALALNPNDHQIWRDCARALESLQRLPEALDDYQRAVTLMPEDLGAAAGILSCSVRTCAWTLSERTLERLRRSPSGVETIHPFLALSVCHDPAEQLHIGTVRCRDLAVAEPAKSWRRRPQEARIRIAYVSSDLRDHAVAYLLSGILRHHARGDFEIHAVALQAEAQQSGIGRELRGAVEHFHDVSACGDAATLQLLRELELDIAVDLNGHTIGARPAVFAQRAAPVQVSYLGYAGTLGARYMDYLLADEVVIPAGQEGWYSEQVVRLPHCYLPNDDAREVAAAPTRAQAGLPQRGLVFCAFTNAYKINPPVFEIWMRLLRESPGSVLWLRGMGGEARENLGREAQARGVEAKRLVFAAHMPSMAEHLGRQGLADLYLDTLPYNAHSTACDALWAGVPVLTCAGSSFASRVAASALRAVGLPELITHSLEHYQERGLELARDPQQLAGLRSRLGRQRSSAPLFDTRGYTRHLESAYRTMHERSLRGAPPAAFAVSALSREDRGTSTPPVFGGSSSVSESA